MIDINSFQRPRDGLLMIYLSAKSKDNVVDTTLTELAEVTGWTVKQLRNSLDSLAKLGNIERNGKSRIKILSKKPVPKTVRSGKDFETRKKNFYDSLVPFLTSQGGLYPPSMVRDFYNYWSEPTKSHNRMRFEGEGTWDLKSRLSRWAKLDKIYHTQRGNNNDDTEKLSAGADVIAYLDKKGKADKALGK